MFDPKSKPFYQNSRISLFVFLCLLLFGNTVFGQSAESPVIDSLKLLLKKETKDTSQIKQLCALSFEYSSRNTEKGIECAEKALTLSKKINWKKGSALSLQFLGRNYWRAGDFKSALRCHQQSLDLWVKIGESKYIATLYLYIGQDYADSHDYLKAIEYLGQSLEIYKSIGSLEKIATVHGIIAWIYDNMGMTAEFKKNELEALRISEELNDAKSVAIYTSNLASELIDQKKYNEAIQIFERCNATLKKGEDYINLTLGYIEMSRCYRESKNDVHAMKLLDTALLYGKKVNNRGLIGDVYVNFASIYTVRKDHESAIKSLAEAIENYKTANNFRDLLEAYNLVALNFIQKKQYGQAAEFLNKEKTLLPAFGSTATRSLYYHELYLLDSATGKSTDASVHYKMYIAAFDSLYMQENMRKSAQAKMLYEFKKSEAAAHLAKWEKDILVVQDIIIKERAQKHRLIIISVVLFLVIILSIAGFHAYKKRRTHPENEIAD